MKKTTLFLLSLALFFGLAASVNHNLQSGPEPVPECPGAPFCAIGK